MTIYRGVNGVNRKIVEQYRNINGTNRKIMHQIQSIDGISKNLYKYKKITDVFNPSKGIDLWNYVKGERNDGSDNVLTIKKEANGISVVSPNVDSSKYFSGSVIPYSSMKYKDIKKVHFVINTKQPIKSTEGAWNYGIFMAVTSTSIQEYWGSTGRQKQIGINVSQEDTEKDLTFTLDMDGISSGEWYRVSLLIDVPNANKVDFRLVRVYYE